MRYTKIICFACIVFVLLFACNNNSAATDNSKQAAASTGNATAKDATASDNKAVFSYLLDGVKISGGATDITQFNNSAQIVKEDNNGSRLQFFLNDADKENAETFPHSLRFVIPGKTGTTTVSMDDTHWNVGLFIAGADGKYTMYQNEPFQVTISVVDDTHVAGTFSGKVKLIEGQTAQKQELAITEGKFDIPIRK